MSVPFKVRAAILMLLVRGGLTEKLVVKVEISSLTPQPCAIAVVTVGWSGTRVIVAVRVREVSAASNAARAAGSSNVSPTTAGTTFGSPATSRTVASTGTRTIPGATARMTARRPGASMPGRSVPVPSGTIDSAGAYCAGWSVTVVRPVTTLTG